MKFEYKTVLYWSGHFSGEEQPRSQMDDSTSAKNLENWLAKKMNELGIQGWEYVGTAGDDTMMIFKRELSR